MKKNEAKRPPASTEEMREKLLKNAPTLMSAKYKASSKEISGERKK